jgi:hypothetical protein
MSDSITIKKTDSRVLERKLTSERRKAMKIVVLSFNLSHNKLASSDRLYLTDLFKETKYYYNYLLYLSQISIIDDFGNLIYPNNIFNHDTKSNFIKVYDTSIKQFFDYELKILSSQMKQKIKDKLTDNIKGLSERKKTGGTTGKLKYKSLVNVPFKQYNNTYRLDNDFKYLSIQGNNKRNFKLNANKALNQFSQELGFKDLSIEQLLEHEIIELANAELVKKNNKYQFKLTMYINPVVLNKNTQRECINNIHEADYKPYQKVRVNSNRINFLNTRIKILSQSIRYYSNNVNLDNIFDNIKKHNEVQKYGRVRQFHMNFTQEQLDILSNTCVGIDAGIADEMTFNCGEIYTSFSLNSRSNIYLEKTLNKIKVVQTELNHFINRSKKLNRKKGISSYNKSQKYYQIKNRLNRLWDKYENIKDNMVNHVVSFFKHFNKIYFQEEMIKSWHQDKLKGYGKKIQQGILGKVYAKLKILHKEQPDKYIMLAKSARTTKTCVLCKKSNEVKLSDRVYECSCGYRNNRDCHSAYNMMILGGNKEANNVIDNLISIKVSGIETSNLVQKLTSITTTQLVYDVVVNKLILQSHIISAMSKNEPTSEASSFRAM